MRSATVNAVSESASPQTPRASERAEVCATAGQSQYLHGPGGNFFWRGLEQASTPSGSFKTWHIAAGILLLTLLAAIRMYWTWATWGDVSIDCGREVYVPAVLRQGQVLYRDVWYLYGPAGPYFNSLLFRIFGVHLYVAWFAGALSALCSGIFLFLTGVELAFPWAGWTAGAVLVIEAFEPGLFSFPQPYSFASVYGCLVVCALLWLLVRGLGTGGWAWMGGAGLLAAAALLLKLEFGVAAYAGLAMAMALRWLATKDWKRLGRDAAATLPGVAICAVVIGWMVSLRGVGFITQENIQSWPTSFFMRTYGKEWLAHTGLQLNREAFVYALKHTVFAAGVLLAVREVFSRRKRSLSRYLLLVLLLLGLVAYAKFMLWSVTPLWIAQVAFFPRAMVLYTVIGAGIAAWCYKDRVTDLQAGRVVLLLALVCLLAFRLMLNNQADGYPIYYNGPVALGYLILLAVILGDSRAPGKRQAGAAAVALVGCLAAVSFCASFLSQYKFGPQLAPLHTAYGTLQIPERKAENYEAAMRFISQKRAQGDSVLVLPEDTMLYFLTGTRAPTRVYCYMPGVVAPGKMTDELFREIEAKQVKYLLWSNRTFSEYGVPEFGQDFNQELAGYLTARYKPLGTLVPSGQERQGFRFMVWEREAPWAAGGAAVKAD